MFRRLCRRPQSARAHADTLALIGLLDYAPWNPESGREVVRELVVRGGDGVPDLVAALGDAHHSPVTRAALAWVLGAIGGPEADAALERAAEDVEPAVASMARRRTGALSAA